MIVSFGFFGVVVRTRSPYIAPRCTARPRDVIYNPSPSSKAQKPGSPMFGWIPWCNELSYDQLLRGVPGTGTRQGGLQGALLKVNLDGIVLLRFHGTWRHSAWKHGIRGGGRVVPWNDRHCCTLHTHWLTCVKLLAEHC